MSRIFITRKIFDSSLRMLDKANLGFAHNEKDIVFLPEELQAGVHEAEAVICLLTDRIDAAFMDAGPNLKIIANVAVGYDNIDVAAATERGITVTNTPGVLTETTADLAFTLMLAVARRVVEADGYMRNGHFQGWELFQPHLGCDVFGKTLGIVGMGRIGEAVARRAALGFGMRVIYTANGRKEGVERDLGAERTDFETLLRESNFVSIHTPLTPETRHMFTLEMFRRMKREAILVNTARGPVVKEEDLAQALAEGLIRGAGLDVYEWEPEMVPALAGLKNCVLLPHVGSATVETRQRMSDMAAENVVAALTGGRIPHPVN